MDQQESDQYVYTFFYDRKEIIYEKPLQAIEDEIDAQLSKNGCDINSLICKCQILYKYHLHYSDALVILQKILTLDPLNIDARLDLITLMYLSRKYSFPVQYQLINECLELDPFHWRTLFTQSLLLQDECKSKESNRILAKAYKLHPNVQVIKSKHLQERSIQNPEDLDIYQQSMEMIENSKSDFEKLSHFACIFQEFQKKEQSFNFLEKALKLNPKSGFLLNNFGFLERVENSNEVKCIEYCQKALDLLPDDDDSCYNIGISYLHQNNIEKSKEYLKRCISKNKQYKNAYFDLAEIYMEMDEQIDKCIYYIQKYKQLLSNKGFNTSFYMNYIYSYIRFDNQTQHLADFEISEQYQMSNLNSFSKDPVPEYSDVPMNELINSLYEEEDEDQNDHDDDDDNDANNEDNNNNNNANNEDDNDNNNNNANNEDDNDNDNNVKGDNQ